MYVYRWENKDFEALKHNMERSHRQLHKLLTKYEAALNYPVKHLFQQLQDGVCVCVWVCVLVYVCFVCVCVCVCVCVHTRVYLNLHTHTHTHTQARSHASGA